MEAAENAQKLQPSDQSQQSQQLPPNASETLYKNHLQMYAQRAGLDLPVYHTKNTGQAHAPQFKSSVTVDDETYESLSTFSQKKAAEQDAAKHALKCIFEKRQEKGSSIINKDTTLCKAMLNEFAAKLQVKTLKYNTVQTQQLPMPIFFSTLEFRGVSYTGGPARTKREAEQLVARDVLISNLDNLSGNQEEDLTLLEILLSKSKLISAMELSMDPSCVTRLNEGSNSASDDTRTPTTQQDPSHDVLMLTYNEEQSKEASKSLALQIEGQNPAPMQTLVNESSKVTSPSPADESLSIVHSSSQNPINPPLQVLANEAYNATPQPEAHEPISPVPSSQNPANPPMQLLANEAYKAAPSPQAHEPVSFVPSTSQNPINPPLQVLANENYNAASAPQAHKPIFLVSSSSQNLVTTQMHHFANQICEIGYGQVDRSGFPVLPQHLTAPPPPPQVVPTAVAPIHDICVSCASQLTERMNRKQRKRARKKARMATQ